MSRGLHSCNCLALPFWFHNATYLVADAGKEIALKDQAVRHILASKGQQTVRDSQAGAFDRRHASVGTSNLLPALNAADADDGAAPAQASGSSKSWLVGA